MALPTAATPGYGYLYTLGGTPDVGCNCVREWWGWFVKLCVRRGYGTPVLWQATGDYSASGGSHEAGGAMDWGGLDLRKVALAREMGAPATWARKFYKPSGATNFHTHGVLSGCVHNEPARYQILAQWLGRDGLGYKGLKGPDPHPRPDVYRDWREGIAWAKAQLGLTTTTTEDDMFTDADRKALLYVHDQGRAIASAILTLRNLLVRMLNDEDAENDAQYAALRALLEGQDVEDVWGRRVLREGGSVPAIQELADIKTMVIDIAKDVDELKAGQ